MFLGGFFFCIVRIIGFVLIVYFYGFLVFKGEMLFVFLFLEKNWILSEIFWLINFFVW